MFIRYVGGLKGSSVRRQRCGGRPAFVYSGSGHAVSCISFALERAAPPLAEIIVPYSGGSEVGTLRKGRAWPLVHIP